MKFFIYNCFFLLIVFIFAYFNTLSHQRYTTNSHVEAFTPKLRELYRPYTRNIRHISEGVYNKHTSIISNLLRKYGII
jgi:hypothetical protein